MRLRIRVAGVVQGVGYRYYAVHRARGYGLTGWVRNSPDGAVEIEAVGPPGPLQGFVEDMRIGPPSAHVSSITVDKFDDEPRYHDFEVRY